MSLLHSPEKFPLSLLNFPAPWGAVDDPVNSGCELTSIYIVCGFKPHPVHVQWLRLPHHQTQSPEDTAAQMQDFLPVALANAGWRKGKTLLVIHTGHNVIETLTAKPSSSPVSMCLQWRWSLSQCWGGGH